MSITTPPPQTVPRSLSRDTEVGAYLRALNKSLYLIWRRINDVDDTSLFDRLSAYGGLWIRDLLSGGGTANYNGGPRDIVFWESASPGVDGVDALNMTPDRLSGTLVPTFTGVYFVAWTVSGDGTAGALYTVDLLRDGARMIGFTERQSGAIWSSSGSFLLGVEAGGVLKLQLTAGAATVLRQSVFSAFKTGLIASDLIGGGGLAPEPMDPIAQPVLDRLPNLTDIEKAAVINLVTCLHNLDMWDTDIKNVWGFGLNNDDFLTAWKDDSIATDSSQVGPLVPGGASNPTHIVKDGAFTVSFSTTSSKYYRTTNTTDKIFGDKAASGVFAYRAANTEADGNYLQSLFGAIDSGGNQYECQWRGAPLRDYDLAMASDGPTPRPPDAVSPKNRFGDGDGDDSVRGDTIGGWTTGALDGVLQQLDEQLTASRTASSYPTTVLEITGLNNDGTSANHISVHLSLLVMISADSFSSAQVTSLRNCMNQFARDIGILNVGQVDP